MRKVEVKTLFIDGLKKLFVPLGYKAITAKNMFVFKSNEKVCRYYFEIHDGYDVQKIVDGFDLRLHSVEQLLKKIFVPYFPKWDEDGDRATFHSDYGFLRFNKIDYSYPSITKQEEANSVLNTIMSFMKDEGLGTLERYSNIWNIDKDFNDRDKIDNPPRFYYLQLGKYPDYRFRQTLIARACDNPIYDYLVEKTRQMILSYGLSEKTKNELDCFNGLVAYLESDEGKAELIRMRAEAGENQ